MSYKFTDTGTGWKKDDKNYPDISVPPSQFNLDLLYDDPDILLKSGDLIKFEVVGTYQPGPVFSDSASGLIAVFRGSTGFLSPGVGGQFSSIYTPPTCSVGIPTDIPQDFYAGPGVSYVPVPEGAKSIQFSVNDCYFKDNSDPDGDFSFKIKITVDKVGE